MIVSGFTMKKKFYSDECNDLAPGQHSHCIRCRQVNCTQFADNVTACVIVTCELCGWRCHECKQGEHQLTCPEERVQCVNKEYGCPHVLKRSRMSSHLPVCPASVVCCAEEWSRWPMHAKDKGMRLPLPNVKTYLDCGQLDVGLAMRDQRMLIDSLRAPHKLRRTLRNHLTQKYPAAPLTHRNSSFDSDAAASADTSQTVSDDETDAPWDLSKLHPGLKESIRSRLFKVTKETTDSLASALEVASMGMHSSPARVLGVTEGGDSHDISCALCRGSPETDLSVKSVINEDTTSDNKQDLPESIKNGECIEKFTSFDSGDRSTRASQSADRSLRSSRSSDRFSDTSMRSKSILQDFGGTQLYKLLGYLPEEGPEIHLGKMLGVNIGFECINKYVAKPASMYTFICAQNFRRDEYRWHFKNVHLEIHQGFSGWLEQRCPLAQLGCTYSFHRMEPTQPNRQLHHSPLLESFGLKSTVQPMQVTRSRKVAPDNHCCSAISSKISKECQEATIKKDTIQEESACNKKTPSINDLVSVDKDFQLLTPDQFNLCHTISEDAGNKSESKTAPTESQHRDGNSLMRVKPTVYTAVNWDSKVLFQYDVEEDNEDKQDEQHTSLSLASLPFEILQHIAQHLDSFSLCNLSLTCHLLRDVCCSLLNDHGIVLLNWQRQKLAEGSGYTWRVASKRWLFSTSFEPIRAWKFTDNYLTMADHLKVCAYNKDILSHAMPFRVTELPSQLPDDSQNKALSWLVSHSAAEEAQPHSH
ncbi:F-box only protein 30 [Biomphalaria glabrata]|nr:F-box only protein 30-like [Biomphalaria glabrata]